MSDISKEPYKGVRDFFPEDMYIQRWMFERMREVVERYGYSEYGASVLEPASLYRSKSSEEIVNEQMYTFTDRGEREVALRPEMTPTVARMVAAQHKSRSFPLRWFSIPNLFRYERPQKGRLREHWQLNVDLFGIDSVFADVEVITIAHDLLTSFGVSSDKFEIRISDRGLVNAYLESLNIDDDAASQLIRLIDKSKKIGKEAFEEEVSVLIGEKSSSLITFLEARSVEEITALLPDTTDVQEKLSRLEEVSNLLTNSGVENVIFDPTLVRGFDYYTGIVFEIYDVHPENNRSLFGGGRFDNLLEVFGEDRIPAIGFGMGDVTLREVLETYDLLPEYVSSADLYICVISEGVLEHAYKVAHELREKGIHVAVELAGRAVSTQIKDADSSSIPYILCIGEDEAASGEYTLKELSSGKEIVGDIDKVSTEISATN